MPHTMKHGLLLSITAAVLVCSLSACIPALSGPSGPARPNISSGSPVTEVVPSLPTSTRTPGPDATATATLAVPPVSLPTPTPTPPAWEWLAPGISQTYVPAPISDVDATTLVYALRLDPERVTFRVHYNGEQPLSIEEWQAATGADVVVNGSFFSGDLRPVERLVVDGQLIGTVFDYSERIGTPGLFAVIDHTVQIYALGRSAYTPRGMRFDQAVESYPMLLLPGRQPAYPEDTGQRSRRTVIGIDEQGYVVIVLIDSHIFSLYELSRWLAASNLNLDTALNLDGGRSSGLMVALPTGQKLIEAYVPLPIVITASLDRR